jgi:hypothetical protein
MGAIDHQARLVLQNVPMLTRAADREQGDQFFECPNFAGV